MRRLLLACVFCSCLEPSPRSLPRAPELLLPVTWETRADDGSTLMLMTREEHARLVQQIEAARQWERDAEDALDEEGRLQ